MIKVKKAPMKRLSKQMKIDLAKSMLMRSASPIDVNPSSRKTSPMNVEFWSPTIKSLKSSPVPMDMEMALTCQDYIRARLHVKQGPYGICYFVALLNAIMYSEGITKLIESKPMTFFAQIPKVSTVDDVMKHIHMDISQQPCIPPEELTEENISKLQDYLKNTLSYKKGLLYEYNNYDEINKHKFQHIGYGGWSYEYVYKYFVRLGFKPNSIKHVFINGDMIIKAGYLHKNKPLRFHQILSDYLSFVHQKISRPKDKLPDVLFITQFVPDTIQVNLAKYICLLWNDMLYVYTLDCMILNSLVNPKRPHLHAICAITCKKKGFIINSHDPSPDEQIVDFKNCSVYQYDWINWPKDTYISQVYGKNGCHSGKTITMPKDKLHLVPSEQFLYHKDYTTSTFFYIKSAIQLKSHYSEYELNTYLQPYMYLLRHNLGIDFEFTRVAFSTYKVRRTRILQEGMIVDPQLCDVFSLKFPNIKTFTHKDLYEVFPNDVRITVSSLNTEFIIYYILVNTMYTA